MKTAFTGLTDLEVPVIDADAHVHEPPELWQARVPARWSDRAPRVDHTDDGDWWIFEDGRRRRPVGLGATAGLGVVQFRAQGVRYADMRAGCYDAKARLADLDADGIQMQVLYPTVALEGARLYAEERELQLACVRAYNEWLAEFCEIGAGRLIGQGIIPTTGIDDAIAETEAAIALGHRGVVLSAYPNGSPTVDPDDDRFWRVTEEASLPVSIHIGSFVPPRSRAWPDTHELAFLGIAGAAKAGAHAIELACELLFAGMLDRFPELRVVLVESNIGWIPTMLEQLDAMYLRYRWIGDAVERMPATPSELFHRSVWTTFLTDTVGLETRYRTNLDHLMWSSDYPHDTSDWPNSRTSIEHQFRGLPIDEVRGFLCGNAAALYGLDLEAPG